MIPALATDIAPMAEADIERVYALEAKVLEMPQIEIETTHTLHAGVYTRTAKMPANSVLTGALIRVPTTLVIAGDVSMFAGDESVRIVGYHVLTAAAGRKQAFIVHAETHLTMIFATQARSVEEAEDEFTFEAHRLMSRRLAIKES